MIKQTLPRDKFSPHHNCTNNTVKKIQTPSSKTVTSMKKGVGGERENKGIKNRPKNEMVRMQWKRDNPIPIA